MQKYLPKIGLLVIGMMTVMGVYAEESVISNPDSTKEKSGDWEIYYVPRTRKMTFGDWFNNLTLPLEVGCVFTPEAGNTRPGFYMRTSLEYRDKKTASWAVAIEYDAYTRSYQQQKLEVSNVVSGSDWSTDILLGGGYRFPFVRNIRQYLKNTNYINTWSMGMMLYAGASCSMVESVTPIEGAGGQMQYETKNVSNWVPSMKMTLSVEYSICYPISVYATVGYLQHLKKQPLEQNYIGEMITSVGITCFFR